MAYNQIATIVFDNGLLIGILGLITGMAPGILLYLVEREKLKHARDRVATERRTVGRLEELLTQLQNTLISIKDRDAESVNPEVDSSAAVAPPSRATQPERAPAEPLTPRTPTGSQLTLPSESSGKYVIWMSLSVSDSPRYVLLSWDSGGASFRIRDYLSGIMLYPRGIAIPDDANFQSTETAMTFGEIWQRARCHMKVRGELEESVSEFAWWNTRLSTLTEGHEIGRQTAPHATSPTETRGALLMLTSDQQPPPRTEVRWHAEQSARRGTTYLATTRILTDLVNDKSLVAFYGNASLFNQTLGYGIFLDFIRTSTPEGRKILDEHPHYQQYGRPDQVLGLIHMRDFRELPAGACLEIFSAKIDGSGTSRGRPLTLVNIPEGNSRALVYFKSSSQVPSA